MLVIAFKETTTRPSQYFLTPEDGSSDAFLDRQVEPRLVLCPGLAQSSLIKNFRCQGMQQEQPTKSTWGGKAQIVERNKLN